MGDTRGRVERLNGKHMQAQPRGQCVAVAGCDLLLLPCCHLPSSIMPSSIMLPLGPRHHLLGMGDELREEGYIELWHALHGMRVWIMRGPGRAHRTAHERKTLSHSAGVVVCL